MKQRNKSRLRQQQLHINRFFFFVSLMNGKVPLTIVNYCTEFAICTHLIDDNQFFVDFRECASV